MEALDGFLGLAQAHAVDAAVELDRVDLAALVQTARQVDFQVGLLARARGRALGPGVAAAHDQHEEQGGDGQGDEERRVHGS